MSTLTRPPIRVLVVDDSAFARKVVREILLANGVQVVGTARDGHEALELTATLQPDIVICDLRMPNMDGVQFVRTQMGVRPVPIMILSAAAQDAAEVVEALSAGAVDVVQKPTALATDELRAVGEQLLQKVRTAVSVPVERLVVRAASPAKTIARETHTRRAEVVVIGISTGGPQALRRVIPMLPSDFPVPIAIVLHMPVGYTALYAEKLNEISSLAVKEAAEGDLLVSGRVLIAAAGRHLGLRRNPSGEVVAQLSMQPLEKLHRPSADVLFRSAAEVYGGAVLAVVMTGMGDDGREGAAWVKAQGGSVITEAEASCVVYGMPRSVVEAGLSDVAVPLEEMAQAITSKL